MCRLGTGRADWARGCMILYLRPHGIICETLQRSAAKRSARTTTSHMWLTPAGQTSAQGARKGNTTLRGDTEAWASEVAEPRYSKMLLACAVQDCQRKTVWYSLDHRGEPTCQTIPPPSISSEYDYATMTACKLGASPRLSASRSPTCRRCSRGSAPASAPGRARRWRGGARGRRGRPRPDWGRTDSSGTPSRDHSPGRAW